jgi:hypothetical protein
MRRALVLLLLAGCAASEDEVRAEFDDYVAGANSCTMAADCTVIYPACPLGCWRAVRADRKADVEAKARELVKRYQRGGAGCAYSCISAGPVACVANRCTFAEPDAGASDL